MSSGCESGWTTYLDQHFNSTDDYSNNISDKHYQRKGTYVSVEEDDDCDLSMVSDASSGPPPQFHVYQNCAEKKKKKKKNRMKEPKGEGKNLYLDDTATSPLCNFSQDELGTTASTHTSMEHVPGFSQALPTTNSQKDLGFFKSSQKEKTASAKSGGLLGRKRQ